MRLVNDKNLQQQDQLEPEIPNEYDMTGIPMIERDGVLLRGPHDRQSARRYATRS